MTSAQPIRSARWQRFRRVARGCRVSLLFVLLLAVAGLVYLDTIGLPGFLKKPILASLRAHGVDLRISRLRLHWFHGFVAENIGLEQASAPFGPQLLIDRAELRFNRAALGKLRLELTALEVQRGRVLWPMPGTHGEPPQELSLDNLSAQLHFLPGDEWELANLQARGHGVQVSLSGRLTHASWVSRWGAPRIPTTTPSPLVESLRKGLASLQRIRFSSPPHLALSFRGDAQQPSSIQVHLNLGLDRASGSGGDVRRLRLAANWTPTPGTNGLYRTALALRAGLVKTTWGEFNGATLTGRFTHSGTNVEQATWQLRLKQGQTLWGEVQDFAFAGRSLALATNGLFQSDLETSTGRYQGRWGKAARSKLGVVVLHPWPFHKFGAMEPRSPPAVSDPLSRLVPFRAEGTLDSAAAQSKWGEVRQAHLGFKAQRHAAGMPSPVQASWGFWARLAPYDLDWDCALDQVKRPDLTVDKLTSAGQWHAPGFSVHSLETDLCGGQLNANLQLNVATRELRGQTKFNLDLHQFGRLLDTNAQRFLAQFGWRTPPEVQGQARLLLPAWTNPHPSWKSDVLPTLALEGYIQAGTNSFRGARASAAQLHLSLSNRVWHIPDLVVVRPEGRLELSYRADLATRSYAWTLHSQIDPQALKPLLAPAQQRSLDLFRFTTPPELSGQIWGHWSDTDRLGFAGRIQATNLTFRGETVSGLDAVLQFTNQFLAASPVHLRRGDEFVFAPGVSFDLAKHRVYLTNVTARIDPMAVARAIGPKTAKTLAPYHFEHPPEALVDGSLDVPSAQDTDLKFVLSGGPFQYWRFDLPSVSATVLWKSDLLVITNFTGQFYQGRMAGHLAGDFSARDGGDLQFYTSVTNAALRPLLQDATRTTNRLEGLVSGRLNITQLNTEDWQSWQGAGQVGLRQGLIWDIPLFGFLSPLVNALVPGLGNNRATEGSATFNVKDSVISSKDLEIRAAAVRLHYTGTIDFQGRVNARVEAYPLRGIPVLGRLVSVALSPVTKLFEYKITGTLKQPKSEPIFLLPKFFTATLHPFRTLKELFLSPSPRPPASLPPPHKPGAPSP